jgi:signal transduction histidine kinase
MRLTGLLLVVSLLTTAVLALQAQATFLYHRGTAEQVLRDYARLAADELIRRSTARIGYDGYLTLLTAIGRRVQRDGQPDGLLAALRADPDPRLQRAAALASSLFTASPETGRLAMAPEAPPAVRSWLIERVREPGRGGEPFRVVHGVVGGVPRSFVFRSSGERPDREVVGFEVNLPALTPWLAGVLDAGPLLPPSVGRGRVTNASLSVVVTDQGGVERFRAGPASPSGMTVDVPFGAAYSGLLEGTTVRVAIDFEAARQLVIGGLPRSRFPLVLGLLGLSTALVVTALFQVRRERALQRLRAEFVASVSHELRTPLAQIRMFAETLLLERVRSDEERRRALQILDREARRLTHLVDNVLQFSRRERETGSLVLEARPLAGLVREVVDQFQPIVAAAGARLALALDEAAVARVDADALRQVLLNLLDNAVKYGPRDQEVRVEVGRSDGVVRLAVQDQGPGIPPRERRRVFDRFHRLERDRRSAVAGTGIGLAVVRDLVERQGGSVRVEDAPGGGARFLVELPA